MLPLLYVAVGCEIDNEKMELMLSQVKGKDITELLAAGREKFAAVPSGGGGVAVSAAAPAAGGAAAPAAESKKEEKVVEKEESDDVRSLFPPVPLLGTSIISILIGLAAHELGHVHVLMYFHSIFMIIF